mmetsp:Transcript_105738/g.341057  ORF Transcript_105738/g.341057 Transcript_105738/m.341057 type:complete len:321 (-) Transcript_105738:410-1372(-)
MISPAHLHFEHPEATVQYRRRRLWFHGWACSPGGRRATPEAPPQACESALLAHLPCCCQLPLPGVQHGVQHQPHPRSVTLQRLPVNQVAALAAGEGASTGRQRQRVEGGPEVGICLGTGADHHPGVHMRQRRCSQLSTAPAPASPRQQAADLGDIMVLAGGRQDQKEGGAPDVGRDGIHSPLGLRDELPLLPRVSALALLRALGLCRRSSVNAMEVAVRDADLWKRQEVQPNIHERQHSGPLGSFDADVLSQDQLLKPRRLDSAHTTPHQSDEHPFEGCELFASRVGVVPAQPLVGDEDDPALHPRCPLPQQLPLKQALM